MVTDNKLYKVAITVDGNYVHGKHYDTLTQVYYAEEDGGEAFLHRMRMAVILWRQRR